MITARQPVTRQADQTLAAQIADDYLAKEAYPPQEMRQRIEEIVLKTISEARTSLIAIKTDAPTVITGGELCRRLG